MKHPPVQGHLERKNPPLRKEEDEIEKYVKANMQELDSEKWLCTLSGKKFKAPEFVRKHIFNKFGL